MLDMEQMVRHDARDGQRHQSPKQGRALLSLSSPSDTQQTIDVWLFHPLTPEGLAIHDALAVQLAYVLHSNKEWKRRTQVRLLKAADTGNPQLLFSEHQRLKQIANELRLQIRSENIVLFPKPGHAMDKHIQLNTIIQQRSLNTCQIFISLPMPPSAPSGAESYWQGLKTLTNNLPSTVMLLSAEDREFISTCI